MPFLFINTLDCLAFFLLRLFSLSFSDYRRRHGIPYPPGPPSRPAVGSLPDVAKEVPWIASANMSKKYRDVFCLHVFGQVVVVLRSLPASKDLLEKRGDVYVDRPTLPIIEITELNRILGNARKGEVWCESRKLADRSLREDNLYLNSIATGTYTSNNLPTITTCDATSYIVTFLQSA